MKPRSMTFALAALVLTACATALPPVLPVSDVRTLADTYGGRFEERAVTARPARLVINPDGTFEITVAAPQGFRTTGVMTVQSGSLVYRYDQVQGTGTVHEGDGRRAVVLTQSDGQAKLRVERSLP